jgi:hypothetical protein
MPRYAITEKAGRFVAAHRNTGVGMVLELTAKQAEHELRLGTLMPLDASPEPADPIPATPTETGSQHGPPPPINAGSDATRKIRRGKQ